MSTHLSQAELQSVFREYNRFVWRLARRLGADPVQLDDTVQDVFLVVVRKLAGFERRSKLTTWLHGITFNVVREQRRAGRREREALASHTVLTAGLGRVDVLASQDAAHDLVRMLDALDLNSENRAIYVFSELYEMSSREIGECLMMNPNTVDSRLKAVRQKIARHLGRRDTDRRVAAALPLDTMLRADEAVGPDPAMEERVWAELSRLVVQELRGSRGSKVSQRAQGPEQAAMPPPRSAGLKLGIGLALVVAAILALPGVADPGVAVAPAWTKDAEALETIPSAWRIPDAVGSTPAASESTSDIATPPVRRPRVRESASPQDELALFVAIRAAIEDGDSVRALGLIDRHKRLFGGRGQLEQERMASEVEALCGLGRAAAARRVAEGMLALWPDSPLGRSVRAGCAFH